MQNHVLRPLLVPVASNVMTVVSTVYAIYFINKRDINITDIIRCGAATTHQHERRVNECADTTNATFNVQSCSQTKNTADITK